MTTILELAADLRSGRRAARDIIESCLDRIADPAGEGARAFLSVMAAEARADADAVDSARRRGSVVAPFAGIPIAVKDLADIEGQVTTAGSTVLAGNEPAERDALVVERVRAAGFVPIGRTNMTEFAYSGLGLNAHHDTPRSPWDRATGRIPGGSSSGTAVAVADGMAAVGLGTDTGGSCRIPAAFCGIVGYKPTARRVPLDGIVPLAPSLDSVGPLGLSVDCCAIVDDLFAGGLGRPSRASIPVARLRLGVLTTVVLDDLDPEVAAGFDAALARLSGAGVAIEEVEIPELTELGSINAKGGLATAEAYHWHRELLSTVGDGYDQRVRRRIEPGADQSAADYLDVLAGRRRLIDATARRTVGLDALIMPTVAVIAPPVASFDDDDPGYYSATNLACLRNTSVGNFLDACAISLPATPPGDAPVGLMLMGAPMADDHLFAVARAVEQIVRGD